MKNKLSVACFPLVLFGLLGNAFALSVNNIEVLSGVGDPLNVEIEIEHLGYSALKGGVSLVDGDGRERVIGNVKISKTNLGSRVVILSDLPMKSEMNFLLNFDDGVEALNEVIKLSPNGARVVGESAIDAAPLQLGSQFNELVAETITVREGQSLSGIANIYRGSGLNIQQKMDLIFELNKAAFKDDDVDHLEVGKVLIIPSELLSSVTKPSQPQAVATPTLSFVKPRPGDSVDDEILQLKREVKALTGSVSAIEKYNRALSAKFGDLEQTVRSVSANLKLLLEKE